MARSGPHRTSRAAVGASAQSRRRRATGTLVKALARAWLAEAARRRVYGAVVEIAEAERISKSYISRILRLTLLAPDIVERILDGRPTVGLAQLLKPFQVEWEKQLGHSC